MCIKSQSQTEQNKQLGYFPKKFSPNFNVIFVSNFYVWNLNGSNETKSWLLQLLQTLTLQFYIEQYFERLWILTYFFTNNYITQKSQIHNLLWITLRNKSNKSISTWLKIHFKSLSSKNIVSLVHFHIKRLVFVWKQ